MPGVFASNYQNKNAIVFLSVVVVVVDFVVGVAVVVVILVAAYVVVVFVVTDFLEKCSTHLYLIDDRYIGAFAFFY